MKISFLILILISSSILGQKKDEILLGSLSGMGFDYNLKKDKYYYSDLGLNANSVKSETTNNFDVSYTFNNGLVETKTIKFNNFSDFNFYLSKFYSLHKVEDSEKNNVTSYYFIEAGKKIALLTSFFAFAGENNYENTYKFFVQFEK